MFFTFLHKKIFGKKVCKNLILKPRLKKQKRRIRKLIPFTFGEKLKTQKEHY